MAKTTDIEIGVDYDSYSDIRERHAFVRKVLGIVAAQLLFVAIIVSVFVFYEPAKNFALANTWIMFVCIGISLVLLLILGCFESVCRSFPTNVILLALFTTVEGIGLGVLCAMQYGQDVVMAFGVTFALCLVLILFACQVKFDFTSFLPFIMIGSLVLLVMGIVAIFWSNKIFVIIICAVGILIFSFYLIIDIQMILGGNHKYQYDPDQYIFAAICIFIDIIALFKYILTLISLLDQD